MSKQQITIRMDAELYVKAKQKCRNEFGIGLAPLIKIFLKAFTTQKGMGFYVGDDDLCKLFSKWLMKKKMGKLRKGCARLPGPCLNDIYNL